MARNSAIGRNLRLKAEIDEMANDQRELAYSRTLTRQGGRDPANKGQASEISPVRIA